MSLKLTLGKAFKVASKRKKAKGRPPHIDFAALLDQFLDKHYNIGVPHYGHWFAEQWEAMNPYQERGQGYFHPSSGLLPGYGCERERMFDLLCAERSPTKMRVGLIRRIDNGTNRHIGLHVAFTGMGHFKFQGVRKAEAEVRRVHPWLPLEGNQDMAITMVTGHDYAIDYKTRAKRPWERTYEPDAKHRLQLNTYMGMGGTKVGYLLYENKDTQEMAGPQKKMRVDFDPKMFAATEKYCVSVLARLAKKDIPAFDERVCNATIDFCSYTRSCRQHRDGASVLFLDQRPTATIKRHLKVLK